MITRIAGSSAVCLAALAFAAGCGGDETEKGSSTAAATSTAAAAAEPEGNTFKAADVGFTFAYPDGFEQVDEPNDGKALATVTPEPGNIRAGLKIRQTSDEKLEFASYSGSIRDQFEDQLGVKVQMRTVNEGAREFGILEWNRDVTYQDLGQEVTTNVRSQSWFFTTGEKTWQLECLSDTDHREAIDAACEQAIGSLEEA